MLIDDTLFKKIKIISLFLIIEVVVFGVGFYSAWEISRSAETATSQLQVNYNENSNNSPTEPLITGATGTQAKNGCNGIKGNISSKSKIYHMPGGAFYDRTQEEMCFKTEAEAKAAGFVKSSR